MRAYRRVGYEERKKFYRLWLAGTSVRSIARKLRRAASTISRELERCGQEPMGYRPELAEEHAQGRWRRNPGLFACPRRCRYVRTRLRDGWSPEQIAGRLRRKEGRGGKPQRQAPAVIAQAQKNLSRPDHT